MEADPSNVARRSWGILAALAAAVVCVGPAAAQAQSPIVQRYFRLHHHVAHGPGWGPGFRERAYRYASHLRLPVAPLVLHPAPKTTQAAPAAPAQQVGPTLSALDRALVDRINAIRTQHGVRPLAVSAGLTAAARQHSSEMLAKGYFAHESADGSSFDKRIRRYYKGLRSAGENIAYGVPDLSPAEAMELWLNSPPHRRNLLDPRWREVGVSIAHADSAGGPDYEGDPTTVATADFGVR